MQFLKRLFTPQFFIGAVISAFIFFILGSILSLFFYIKNVDVLEIRKRQEYLIQEVEELRKEREAILAIFEEKGLIEEWNEEAVIVPEEEGK